MASKLYVAAGAVLVALICLAIIARNWSCRHQRPPRPPREEVYDVISAENGATLIVAAGLRGRRQATVTLSDISAPETGSPYYEPARANLTRLAGKAIRVETARRGRLFGEAINSEEQPEPESIGTEAHGPILGVAYGETGGCLNLGQIMDGWAKCLPSAPKEWRRQEAIARKAKRGIWSKEK